ncbi:MAG: mechanosensitive ion channel [Saprospiraceae bacterium]|nr:mechanosensitive ion channel [Saprospiraceae bacterium]MCF8250585.1 mechanosensitive ion channel [Saprospiraceae bacterium]MCF8281401.1 mechanosensitive ion channel [Bacteroidales bacterium]MCF8313096.1 mechanosensitive ion channel [Saprospiraceae bacterium]MCF8441540.1 mechanosensitive ion channel [Saprospiraceae bacterium]
MDFKEFLELHINIGKFQLTVAHFTFAILIFLLAKVLTWLIRHVLLERYFRTKRLDKGRQIAIKQFLSYIVWVLAVFGMLQLFGISSMLFASSAALLVGIGLGLQDSFRDLISGIIILMEGTVEVGDVLEVDGIVARVSNIGLRISKLETRDRVSILIPNSNLVINKVTNWTHDDQPTRFHVKVGVAYGSDLKLVTKLLIKSAESHKLVLKDPPAAVQFKNFGDSSLDFELLFYTQEFLRIEFLKSDIRYAIEENFRENNVQIPFPQRDIWLRKLEGNASSQLD